ncbi:MAG: DNA mismatch repair endonuclease MutL [Clostridia bacterium]|nr:DNA mismatch repair endonuclease MutL [Clostridia bacterium]MDE7328701.1 DNA mismatch repair endonuclease MutL [Clostridia bacterium]
MAKINVLDSSVFNLISAGEVVERPSSVVKELVENSIDAGANAISVEIKDGGISSIVITDNGSGIDKENMRLAFLPHATSKLSKAEDLDNIATLGFRGEALASIAAVSQVTMTSKTSEDSVGNYIVLNAGKVVEEGQKGLAQSTSIAVENLFFNTPVRKKFLKKPKMEEAGVTSVMTQLALANPDIKFKYTVDGKIVFQTNGGLEEAVYSVYKNEIANEMLPFQYTYDKYTVYGYTGSAAIAKHNRNYQTIIVNGRVISNSTISTAVSQAYGNRLMTRTFPVFVLNIIMPFDEVDVNVHPTKTDVRFADSRKIFSCVYKAISSVLAEQEQSLILGKAKSVDAVEAIDKCGKISENIQSDRFAFNIDAKSGENANRSTKDEKVDIILSKECDRPKANCSLEGEIPKLGLHNDIIERQKKKIEELKYFKDTLKSSNIVADSGRVSVAKSAAKGIDNKSLNDKSPQQQAEQSSLLELAASQLEQEYEIVGQIFNTYLILESEGKVYFIDQHACHERFIYDNLLKQVNEGNVNIQDMLIPYILECSSYQFEFISSMQENLKELGFDIEEFGGLSFKISSVPLVLSDINLGMFFENLFADKQSVQSLKSSDLIRDRLAQKACKSAIKAGAKLDAVQIKQLLSSMKDGIPLQCPHGRPAVIAYTRKDFDKLFKRIV